MFTTNRLRGGFLWAGNMVPPSNQTDVLQVFIIVAASIFGPTMAQIIGPYSLIIVAAMTGAGWSVGRKRGCKASAIWYFVRIVLTAILLTVAISKMAAGIIPSVEADWLIAPVAMIIGLIGDDWPKAGKWAISIAKRFVNRWLGD